LPTTAAATNPTTNNHFTASVCPQALLGTQLGGVIDVLACENEALTNISLGNDNVLGLLCANTVAATDTDLLGSVTEPTFLPTCLEESVPYLVDTLGGILDNSGAIGQQLCPSSENPVQCLLETLNTVPDSTLAGVLGYLGCDDALNPQVCLTQVADNLAMGEPLIGTVNSLSMALPFEAPEKQALSEALTLGDRLACLTALLRIDAAEPGDDEPTTMQ